MTSGARRGELCALRRRHVVLDAEVLIIDPSVHGRRTATRQKDTKTHQKRRIALDLESVEILFLGPRQGGEVVVQTPRR